MWESVLSRSQAASSVKPWRRGVEDDEVVQVDPSGATPHVGAPSRFADGRARDGERGVEVACVLQHGHQPRVTDGWQVVAEQWEEADNRFDRRQTTVEVRVIVEAVRLIPEDAVDRDRDLPGALLPRLSLTGSAGDLGYVLHVVRDEGREIHRIQLHGFVEPGGIVHAAFARPAAQVAFDHPFEQAVVVAVAVPAIPFEVSFQPRQRGWQAGLVAERPVLLPHAPREQWRLGHFQFAAVHAHAM